MNNATYDQITHDIEQINERMQSGVTADEGSQLIEELNELNAELACLDLIEDYENEEAYHRHGPVVWQ